MDINRLSIQHSTKFNTIGHITYEYHFSLYRVHFKDFLSHKWSCSSINIPCCMKKVNNRNTSGVHDFILYKTVLSYIIYG